MRIIMVIGDKTGRDESAILRAVLMLARQMRRAADDGALTGGALALLGTLHRDGAMSAVALARREGLQPQSLSRLLIRLDTLGLIARSVDPDDARRHVIALTPAGSEILMRQLGKRRTWLADRMTERLSSEEQGRLFDAAALMLRIAA